MRYTRGSAIFKMWETRFSAGQTVAGKGNSLWHDHSIMRKAAGELTALIARTCYIERRGMPLKNMFDDSESETNATVPPIAALVGAKEPFGQPWDIFRFDTDAGVDDSEFRTIIVARPAQSNRTAGRCMANGVGQ